MTRPMFSFLEASPRYRPGTVARLRLRHRFVVAPFLDDIRGARVLDLAAHDGRWSYAYAAAGAAHVDAVEARADTAAAFAAFPNDAARARVRLEVADLYDALAARVAAGARYDVVALLGILYHVMDHYRLLRLIHALGPNLVIVDSEFALAARPMISLVLEDPANPLNATEVMPGRKVPKGVPSPSALERMAESLGWRVDWLDWDTLPEAERGPVRDYYRPERIRRATCALRPE